MADQVHLKTGHSTSVAGGYMTHDWKTLSEAVSREQNPEKLLELVEQLNKALEERENARKHEQHPPKDEDEKTELIPFDEGGDQWFLIA